jgi:Ion channel
MSLCVAIHGGGLTWAMRRLQKPPDSGARFWPWTWLFIRVASWIILLHLLEISVWALFYIWKNAVPDVAASFYFSAVTYTTTGYGDVVLPQSWRLVGGVEALTGILMCGWSTGFFFAIVSRMYEAQTGKGKS